jgi:hypothetical protein
MIWAAFSASFVILLGEGMGSGLGLFLLAPAVPFCMIFKMVFPFNAIAILLFVGLTVSFLSQKVAWLRDPMIIAVSIYWSFSYVLFAATAGMHR